MRIRSLTVPAALLALSCFLHTTPARADTVTFNFTATGNGINASATLTGVSDPTVAGAYDLTGGSGTLNGNALTLYVPSGTATTPETANFTSPPFSYQTSYEYNNVVYTSGNSGLVLDDYGLLFSLADDHFNPYIQGSNYVYSNDETVFGFNSPLSSVTLTEASPTSVTPEPTSIALLATGLLGTAGILRRRQRS